MPILDDGAGQEDTERDCTFNKQSEKDEVGARLRNQAHQAGYQENNKLVLLHPSFQMKLVDQKVHEQQGSKSPEKYFGNMNFGDVIPEMLLQEMIRYCGYNEEGSERDNNQGNLHPVPCGRPQLASIKSKKKEKQGAAEDTAGRCAVEPLCSELPPGEAVTDVFLMDIKFMATAFFICSFSFE